MQSTAPAKSGLTREQVGKLMAVSCASAKTIQRWWSGVRVGEMARIQINRAAVKHGIPIPEAQLDPKPPAPPRSNDGGIAA